MSEKTCRTCAYYGHVTAKCLLLIPPDPATCTFWRSESSEDDFFHDLAAASAAKAPDPKDGEIARLEAENARLVEELAKLKGGS